MGSPRVGSTLLYQFIINHFDCYFPSNKLSQSFEENTWQKRLPELVDLGRSSVPYESKYGKTFGDDQPSEASSVFRYFFGGEHPSETKSNNPLPGMKSKFIEFCQKLKELSGSPLVFKNAWNCFRIKALAEMLPEACFLWIRRDLADSAFSDLESRKKHGGTNTWNSATPKNYREIQKLPYWEQVVEQQVAYTNTISKEFVSLSRDRTSEVWYEDLCNHTPKTLLNLNAFLSRNGFNMRESSTVLPSLEISKSQLMEETQDGQKILKYCDRSKFFSMRYSSLK